MTRTACLDSTYAVMVVDRGGSFIFSSSLTKYCKAYQLLMALVHVASTLVFAWVFIQVNSLCSIQHDVYCCLQTSKMERVALT
jgi:hypothetical protein